MGMHSARRSGAMTTVAGRGLFTATAAFALIGGGAGMAFAGEAPSHGHEHSSDHHGEHASHKKTPDCEIPVVDKGSETVDTALNNATGDATKPALEAGNEAAKPVHDAVCPPARDILGPVAGQLPEAPELAAPETPEAAAPEAAAPEAAAPEAAAPKAETPEAAAPEGATEGAGAVTDGASSVTDLPTEVPAT